jgi:phosphatidylglycerol lysyltransferase
MNNPFQPPELQTSDSETVMQWRFARLAKVAAPVAVVAVFALAIWLLSRALEENQFEEIRAYIERLGTTDIVAAIVLTIGSYVCLIGYDMLALRYVGRRIPLRTIAVTSFISYAFTNSAGFGGLGTVTGGSVRYRLYAAAGLSGFEITAVIAFCLSTFFIGVLFLGGVTLVLFPEALAAVHVVPALGVRAIGGAIVAGVVVYVIWSALRRRVFTIGKWRLHIPSFELTLSQILVSVADIVLAGAALYELMPGDMTLSFIAFLPVYLIALIGGVISHVPGGLGVFEGLLVLLIPGVSPAEAVAALLAYRLVYYLLPLALAAALLAASEIYAHSRHVVRTARTLSAQLGRVAPPVFAVATFFAGTVLLVSGVTPTIDARLAAIEQVLPLAVLEASHLISSLVGVGLLLLSRALLQRLDAAYVLTVALLLTGAVTSLLKGLDYVESALLLVLALALIPARPAFYRRAVLLEQSFSSRWTAAMVVVIAGTTWLGFFAYRHVEYSHALWWQFEFSADAPRFLRASLAVVLVAIVAGVVQLLRTHTPAPRRLTATELAQVQQIVDKSPDPRAHLALLDDKNILFSEGDDGFIMYGVRGRTWAAMGDPIGPPKVRAELAWRFLELCDHYNGLPAFYQVDADNLALYIDLGLSLFKIGDEARVDLPSFSIDRPGFKDLRYVHRRCHREGADFSLIPAADVPAVMTELEQVSAAWIADRKTREKRFSVGFFSEDYLRRCPCAVVRKDGRIIAFSNLWPGAQHNEISLDLMRYVPEALYGVMDFMFVELIHWAKAEGYRWFNLGTAPLSGLEVRRLSPVWYRIGSLAYRFGDQFYSFQGLRKYKEKFGPEWRPKFLASRGGLGLGRVLFDIPALISGSIGGIVRK